MTTDDNRTDDDATSDRLGEAADSRDPASGPTRASRAVFVVAQILVIVPVWVAAYRDGHDGWFPTMDAATTVLKARDTFSAHFPLVGMWSSVSDKLGLPTYFPGATELYLLSVPNRLFGYAWGTLIGMAAINTLWLVCGGWLLRRRLGTSGAVWGLVAFAALVWTMGSEALVDVAPMQMITIPFAVFLIAVWSVADRDLAAIPLLAVLANFLVLNHLVLTLLVPVIGLCAVVGPVIGSRSLRRRDPEAWPAERHVVRRQLLIAAAVTVVLWIPTIIQQVTNSPGNLTNLWNASRVDLARTVTLSHALDVVVSILATPPFWFRDTFDAPLGSVPIGAAGIVIGVALAVIVGLLATDAYRRGDRIVVSALAVAVVAAVASIINILTAPTDFGFRRNYFRSLWGMAMFFWLAIGTAAVRSVAARLPAPDSATARPAAQRLAAVGVVVVLGFTLVALPRKDPGNETNGAAIASVELANKVMNRAIVLLRDAGQVEVSSAGDFMSFGLSSTLILVLDNDGIDVCVPADMVAQYGEQYACSARGPDTRVRVSSTAFPPYPGEDVLVAATLLTKAEQREKDVLGRKVAVWLAEQDAIHASPRVRRILVDAYGSAAADRVEATAFDTRGYELSTLVFSPDFVEFVTKRSVRRTDGSVDAAIDTGSLSPEDLLRWAELTWREYTGESVRIATITDTGT